MRGEDETNFSTEDQWLLNNAVPLTLDDVSSRLGSADRRHDNPVRKSKVAQRKRERTERPWRTSELRSVNRPHAKSRFQINRSFQSHRTRMYEIAFSSPPLFAAGFSTGEGYDRC
jgi:hypothetical protein